MVASQVELAEKIDDFVRRIRSAVAVHAVILFGSYAKGNADDSSDVDVAVISPDFEGMSTWQRQDTIARATAGRGHRLAPVGFASSEYRSPDSTPFLREIIRTGRVVYEAPAE
jgi:stress-induced morphogen